MKIVLDANIVISGLRFGGIPRQILEAVNRSDHSGFTSALAMQEIEKVLLGKFRLTLSEWMLVEEALRETLVVVPAPQLPALPLLRDKKDLHIVAAAELCAADCIVSGDRDLLVLGAYKNIPILRAAAFMQKENLRD